MLVTGFYNTEALCDKKKKNHFTSFQGLLIMRMNCLCFLGKCAAKVLLDQQHWQQKKEERNPNFPHFSV